MSDVTATPRRPPLRPSSGDSRNSTRRTISGLAGSVLGAIRPSSAQSATRGARPTSAGSSSGRRRAASDGAGESSKIGLVFAPRRPPSSSSIMRRQARAFNVSVLEEDLTASMSRVSMDSTQLENYFELVIKPFLVLKGTTVEDRREVFLLWAMDLAHNFKIPLEAEIDHAFTEFVAAARAAPAPQQRPTNGAASSPRGADKEQLSSNGSFTIQEDPEGSSDGSAHTVWVTYVPNRSTRRVISANEVKTFLHILTRDVNMDNVILGTVLLDAQVSSHNSNSMSPTQQAMLEATTKPHFFHQLLTAMQRLQIFLRLLLHCSAVASTDMSDFDFRAPAATRGRTKTDRHFSLSQGSDLDSTDEDNDDGAPRPIDSVILTASELILAHVTRLGLHDVSGAVMPLADRHSSAAAVVDDLVRLVHRLSSDSHADRSFGVLIGLIITLLYAVDYERGIVSREALTPLIEYIEEQRSFYTMKADGASLNSELVEMYERLTEPFYRVVRTLRLLKASVDSDALPADNDDAARRGRHANENEGHGVGTSADRSKALLLTLLESLERFIYYRSAERAYDPAWTHVFHLEMTSRERLLTYERDQIVDFYYEVHRKLPKHGSYTHDGLTGAAGYHLRDEESHRREEVLQEEARKFAFLSRLLDARCTMALEDDPRKIANRLVPTTRAAHVASVYDGDHHVVHSPSRPHIRAASASGRRDDPSAVIAGDAPGQTTTVHHQSPKLTSPRPPTGGASSKSGRYRAAESSPAVTGKDVFFASQRAQQDAELLSCKHEESASRLGVRQQEADHWFAIALFQRIDAEERRNRALAAASAVPAAHNDDAEQSESTAKEEGTDDVFTDAMPAAVSATSGDCLPAASESTLPPPPVIPFDSIHILIEETCLSVETWDAESAHQWRVERLLMQESSMRRDVGVDESLQRDLHLTPMYQTTIADALYTEALTRAMVERFTELYTAIVENEQVARSDTIDAENTTFESTIMKEANASAERLGFLLKVAFLSTSEQHDRGSMMYSEESSLDMLCSMYRLEKRIHADLFRASTYDAEAAALAAARAKDRALREELRLAQQQFEEELEDVLRVESVLRSDIVSEQLQSMLATKRRMKYGVMECEEGAARQDVVATIERLARTSMVVKFYLEGIVILQRDISNVDSELDAFSVSHVPSTAASVADVAADDVLSPTTAFTVKAAAVRAELLLVQQRHKILRGSFRYHLSELLPYKSLESILEATPQELYGLVLQTIASTDAAAVDATAASHHRQVSPTRRLSPTLIEESTVASTVRTTTLPHLANIRDNIRTYSRPISAARAAAAALAAKQDRQLASVRGTLGGASAAARPPSSTSTHSAAMAPSKPPLGTSSLASLGLTERMAAFNRVFLSDTSKQRVLDAVANQDPAGA